MKKRAILATLTLAAIIGLSSCASSITKQIQELQQTQKQLNKQAAENLANIDSLRTKIAKYRLQADELHKKSLSLANDIKDLNESYSNFSDPNNDSAIAVNKELVQKTLQKAKLDEKINQFRSQANDYQAQINDLKATSQTQANQAVKVSEKINELKAQINK